MKSPTFSKAPLTITAFLASALLLSSCCSLPPGYEEDKDNKICAPSGVVSPVEDRKERLQATYESTVGADEAPVAAAPSRDDVFMGAAPVAMSVPVEPVMEEPSEMISVEETVEVVAVDDPMADGADLLAEPIMMVEMGADVIDSGDVDVIESDDIAPQTLMVASMASVNEATVAAARAPENETYTVGYRPGKAVPPAQDDMIVTLPAPDAEQPMMDMPPVDNLVALPDPIDSQTATVMPEPAKAHSAIPADWMDTAESLLTAMASTLEPLMDELYVEPETGNPDYSDGHFSQALRAAMARHDMAEVSAPSVGIYHLRPDVQKGEEAGSLMVSLSLVSSNGTVINKESTMIMSAD